MHVTVTMTVIMAGSQGIARTLSSPDSITSANKTASRLPTSPFLHPEDNTPHTRPRRDLQPAPRPSAQSFQMTEVNMRMPTGKTVSLLGEIVTEAPRQFTVTWSATLVHCDLKPHEVIWSIPTQALNTVSRFIFRDIAALDPSEITRKVHSKQYFTLTQFYLKSYWGSLAHDHIIFDTPTKKQLSDWTADKLAPASWFGSLPKNIVQRSCGLDTGMQKHALLLEMYASLILMCNLAARIVVLSLHVRMYACMYVFMYVIWNIWKLEAFHRANKIMYMYAETKMQRYALQLEMYESLILYLMIYWFWLTYYVMFVLTLFLFFQPKSHWLSYVCFILVAGLWKYSHSR